MSPLLGIIFRYILAKSGNTTSDAVNQLGLNQMGREEGSAA
jgi:hypothetical protein